MLSFPAVLDALLTDWSRRLLGGIAERSVIGAITWAEVSVMLAFLALALVLTVVASIFLRRATRLRAVQGVLAKHQLATAIGRPLKALIWAYGVYFAAYPMLIALKPVVGARELFGALGTALDLATFAVIFWFLYRCIPVFEAALGRWVSGTNSRFDDLLAPFIGRSLRIAVPIVGVIFALPLVDLPARYAVLVSKATAILLILAFAFILLQAARIGEQALMMRFDINAADNLQARKVYTQVHIISRVIDVGVGLLAVASILMMFSEVRRFGASLLASAGIVGVVVGIAAQKTLANLLAGFQIALAQPMRQDDVVIVDGEWGRIEEITLTYVVVHIWDDRRLIVPLSYFIEKPFQNWTRTTAGLLGSVFVWVDYSFPVDEGRRALKQIIEASEHWDKRFWGLQVTDASERTMQLRVLATAADSSSSWALRCEIREKLIAYIRDHHPQSLPLVRAQVREGRS